MKKYFIAIAVAALALSACSKVEVRDEAPASKIAFQVASFSQQTKANVSIISETNSFMSKAFLYAEGVTGVQNFFGETGETITANDNSNPSAWTPSHDYYWPKSVNSYINFVSWYDKNGAPTTSSETSLAWSNRTIATDDNIMWADEAWRFNKNNNPGTYKMNAVTEGVPTLFHHALAKLCIKAKADPVADGNTTWDVTLEGIKITNTYSKGTLTLTNSDPNTAATTKAYTTTGWATSGTAEGISMSNTNTLTTSLVDVLAEQSVLPQALSVTSGETTTAANLEFTLHIITKYNGTKYSEEKIPVTVALNTLGTTPITEWAMNTKYTYNITVNPKTTTVKFDPAVVEWVIDSNAPTYSIPEGQI